jgi:hypothetical protein
MKGMYQVHLSDGEDLVTDRLEYADSALVLHNIIADGKRREIEPRRVELAKIAAIETVRTNWLLTAVFWIPVASVAVVTAYWIFFDAPGGESD